MTRKEPTLGNLDDLYQKAPSKPGARPPARREPEPARPARGPAATPVRPRRAAPDKAVVTAETSPPRPASVPGASVETASVVSRPTLLGVAGRLRRIRYFIHCAIAMLIAGVAALPALSWWSGPQEAGFALTGAGFAVLALAAVWLVLAASVRRARDFNLSPWWLVMVLLPGLNVLVLAALVILPGSRGANRFGPPNPRNSLLVWLAFFVFVLVPIGLTPAAAILYDAHFKALGLGG